MWFFYEETRSDRLKRFITTMFQKIGLFFWRIYYIIILALSVLLFFLTIIWVSIFLLFISWIFKRYFLNDWFERYFNKLSFEIKEQISDSVITSKFFARTAKTTAPPRTGKDRFNVIWGRANAKKLRRDDVKKIKLCKLLIKDIVDIDVLNNMLLDEKIYPLFEEVSDKKIRRAILFNLRSIFKIDMLSFFWDAYTKRHDVFHKSQWIIKDCKGGIHKMNYLVDYIMIFMRLTYKNIYLASESPMYEDICFETEQITYAMPFGENMKKISSEDKENVLHPKGMVHCGTESGVNNSNLDRGKSKIALEDGSAHFPQIKGHLSSPFLSRTTDQVGDRNQAYEREHDEQTDVVEIVNEIPLAPTKIRKIENKKAFREWCNRWLGTNLDVVKLEEKLINLKSDFFLECKVFMSDDGTKKGNKRLWFDKIEDISKGGYILAYAYAPIIYSIYNHQFASYFDGSEEDGKNFFHYDPYYNLKLNEELIKRMGIKNLRKKRKG